MLLADHEKLWPPLQELGETRVREMLAANHFESNDDEAVQEWFTRKAAVSSLNDAKITNWAAIIDALAAIVAAVASVWALFRK